MYYDSPLVCSALNDPNAEDETGTLTFKKNQGNLYYFPKNRNDEFVVYMKSLSELNVNREIKINVVITLYKRTIRMVSTEYRDVMKNPVVCRHYRHEPENVSIFRMIKNVLSLRKVYYATICDGITKKDKRKMESSIFLGKIKKKLGRKVA